MASTNEGSSLPAPYNGAAEEHDFVVDDEDVGDNPQSIRLRNKYAVAAPAPTIPDEEIPKILKGARRGLLEDLKLLVGLLEDDKRELPRKLNVPEEAFDTFAQHVRKPYLPKEPMGRKLTRFGLVTTSLTGIRILGKVFFMNITRAIQMSKLWDDAYRWLKILVEVYLDGTYRDDNPVVAVSAYTFMVIRDLNINAVKHVFCLPDVFKFAFRLWKDDSSADEGWVDSGSFPLAIMCGQMEFGIRNAPFLDVAAEMYKEMGFEDGEEGGIAKVAIERLLAELRNDEYREGAVCFQIDTLYLFAKDDDRYGNKKMLGRHELGLASVVYAFMKLSEADMLWINRMLSASRAVHLLEGHLCRDVPFDALQMRDALRHGLLKGMFNFVRHYRWLDNKGSLLNILDRLLDLLSVPSVLEHAIADLRNSSTNIDIEEIEESPGLLPLVSRLNMVKKVVLERTIMKKLYKVVGREELGFCASNTCHRVGPRTSFKKCSSCRFVLYCSPKCQSNSWKNHRDLCKVVASNKESERGERVHSRPEDRFPRKISTFEITRLLPNLSKLVKGSEAKQVSASRFGFQVDVSVFPTRIRAFDVSTFANKGDNNDNFTVICADVLESAPSWEGDYRVTILKIEYLNDTFVTVVPLKKSAFDSRNSDEDVEDLDSSPPKNRAICQDRYGRPIKPPEGDDVQEISRIIAKRAAAAASAKAEGAKSDSDSDAEPTHTTEPTLDIWDDAFIDGIIEEYLKGAAVKQGVLDSLSFS